MPNMIQGTTIPLLEQMLAFSQSRQTLLAGNIANLDTPGYQARDLSLADFQNRLKDAIETNQQAPSMVSSSASGSAALENVASASPNITISDPSKLGTEFQVNEMVKNHIQHNLAVTLLTQQYHLLEAAISERA